MSTAITPTVGRVVWYWPSQQEIDAKSICYEDPTQPLAATVARVWSDRMVNLSIVDQAGTQFRRTSVQLLQDGDERPPTSWGPVAEWMPYQKSQASKHAEEIRAAVPPAVGTDLAQAGADATVEIKVYADGASAAGTPPLPELSPDQQKVGNENAVGEQSPA